MDLFFVLTGVLGLYLLTCAYAAIGLFMSSITSYQVVAAMGTLAILTVLNFIGEVGQDISFVRDITYWLSISGRAYKFLAGMICSEDVLYFVIVILLFILLSIMRLQAARKETQHDGHFHPLLRSHRGCFIYRVSFLPCLSVKYIMTQRHSKQTR